MRRINSVFIAGFVLGSLPACQQPPDARNSITGQTEALDRSGGARSKEHAEATATTVEQAGSRQQVAASYSLHSGEKGAALPAEASFIVPNGLSESHISKVVQSDDDFRSAIQALERDAATDADAQQINKHYRSSAEAALGGMGVVTALSCGYVLCIGEVRMQGDEAYQRWDSRFGALDSITPVYSLSEMSMPSASNERILRFVASIDSDKNGLSTE